MTTATWSATSPLLAVRAPAVVLALSRDEAPATTVLHVHPEVGGARTVLKVVPASRAWELEAEHAALEALAGCLPPALAAVVPSSLGLGELDGQPAMLVSAVPGAPLTRDYYRPWHTRSPRRVGHDLAVATDWLAAFQAATATGRAAAPPVAHVADRLRARWAGEERLPAALQVLDAAGALDELPVTACATHGDYWHGNLLVQRGRISGVVDWSRYQGAGHPMSDLARLVCGYAGYLDRTTRAGRPVAGHPGLVAGSPGAGLRYAFAGDGWFPTLARQILQDGAARAGLPASLWRAVAILGIAELAADAEDPAFASAHLRTLAELLEQRGQSKARPA